MARRLKEMQKVVNNANSDVDILGSGGDDTDYGTKGMVAGNIGGILKDKIGSTHIPGLKSMTAGNIGGVIREVLSKKAAEKKPPPAKSEAEKKKAYIQARMEGG